jgi:hypothetical protein
MDNSTDTLKDPAIIKRAKEIQEARLKQMASEATKLGISFDPKAEPKIVSDNSKAGGTKEDLDPSQPASIQAINELVKVNSLKARFDTELKKYHTIGSYTGLNSVTQNNMMLNGGANGQTPSLDVMVNGTQIDPSKAASPWEETDPLKTFSNRLMSLDGQLFKPYLLKGAITETAADKPIPVLISTSAAEKLLGLPALSAKATSQQKIERIRTLREQSVNLVFDTCYRNTTAAALYQAAQSQAAELAAHQSDASYTAPAVQYTKPSTKCEPTIVAKDTRSTDEKALDTKTTAFQETFGKAKASTHKIQFRIVGLTVPVDYNVGMDITSIFGAMLLNTSMGEGFVADAAAIDTNPYLKSDPQNSVSAIYNGYSRIVEFPNRQDQKAFLTQHSCRSQDCFYGHVLGMSWGNPLAALYDAADDTATAQKIALGIIALLAALIMTGTIGKAIADSCREPAYFVLSAPNGFILPRSTSYTAALWPSWPMR